MLNNKFLKVVLLVPALAGMSLMANVPYLAENSNIAIVSVPSEDDGITISELIHDFGTIKLSDGDAIATFTITNKSKSSVLITGVKPSCGCTTPSWTKEPIEPGKTGTVTAKYKPSHPAPFEKTITITTTGKPERIVVRIKGVVE